MREAGAQTVLTAWFGPRPHALQTLRLGRGWFGRSVPGDAVIEASPVRERFGTLLSAAERGELDSWSSSPRRRLALILLLDQCTRILHAGTARAWANDAAAQSLALGGARDGADATLDPIERALFYLPLMHAEQLDLQDEAIAAYRRLAAEAPAGLGEAIARLTLRAGTARELIARFGRFPGRNALQGRVPTDAEAAWSAGQPASDSETALA